jgi:hypothetical protein
MRERVYLIGGKIDIAGLREKALLSQ